MITGNEPAYPSEFEGGEYDFTGMPTIVHRKCYGLTKREYFAAMAMQGMYANPSLVDIHDCGHAMTDQAVKAADALINNLNAKP
jgi:hypothetical protein